MAPVTLGSILNTFNWKLYAGNIAPKDLDMEEKFGLTYTGKSSTSVSYPCSTVECCPCQHTLNIREQINNILYVIYKRSKRVAPGPFPLPIIGILHLLGDKPHISLTQLAKKHGPIMNLKLGQVNTVVISSSVLAKQVMQKQDLSFSSRSVPDTIYACNESDFSVIWLPEIKDLVWNIMVEAGKPNLVDYFPFLRRIDPQGRRRRMTNHFTKVQLMNGLIDERLNERKMGNHTNGDVLDSLLNICPQEIDRNHIEHLFLDMFVAGSDTTSNTLEWAMAELLKNPHTLEKAQEELAQVIGRGKLIDEADVAKLSYLRCVVKETFRLHPLAPFLIPRKAVEDVEFCGYIIPKDSQVLVNIWAIGHDSSLWEDPLDFKPERFWELDIDVRGQDFELILFGVGRRICPGLPLAIKMVPLQGGIALNDLDMEEKFVITLAKAQPLLAIPVPL
ncbi:hypothetical protein H5410_047275 [Solanum commersonii]|uniref:Geraniol 10-hydroxylase n=1 Tax=Solanum commersonii TaxID=4109 RepID=A0A9J5XEM0_SOLCO|nr:hypothetical protein H5410_047275 [Solanum commersonii]